MTNQELIDKQLQDNPNGITEELYQKMLQSRKGGKLKDKITTSLGTEVKIGDKLLFGFIEHEIQNSNDISVTLISFTPEEYKDNYMDDPKYIEKPNKTLPHLKLK